MSYIQPVAPLLLLLIAAAAWRTSGPTRRWLLAAVAALALWSWMPVAWLTSGTLEWRYPPRQPEKDQDAIVVLGEGVRSPPAPWQPEVMPSFSSYLRARYAAWLYRNGWRAPILVCGGGDHTPVAEVLRRVLEAEGVPAQMISADATSNSTHENAIQAARILFPRGIRKIALVTEARHMLRAEKTFRKQGFAVSPAPCGYRTLDATVKLSTLVPRAEAMIANDDALHEWLGIGWYWISGKL